jgi:hypothetical protein
MRQRVELDGEWQFTTDPGGSLAVETLSTQPLRAISVPAPWQAQFADLRQYSGLAWYRRMFTTPAADNTADSVTILHFGAVDYFATVWLNGRLLGEHEGGYLPFELECGAALRSDGPNELVVRVVDPGTDGDDDLGFPFAEVPHGKQSWYGPIGGIWQSVYIEQRAAEHLTRVRITPQVADEAADVSVWISRPLSGPRQLELVVTDPLGRSDRFRHRLEQGAEGAETRVQIPAPLLWDTDTPNLYTLDVALATPEAGGAPGDRVTEQFGMRTIGTSPDGHLMLNGKLLYLRGALDQDYYPHTIYTPFDDGALDTQFAMAKHMGLNCIRTHIKITDPRYYAAADRAGMLIWTELPNWQDLTDAAKRRARETMIGMVERDWNHPSIVIWTIVNENWGTDLAVNADHRAWLVEMYTELKTLDPHRLVVGNSPCFTNFHVVTDIEDFHNYYAIPDHYRQWRDWVQTFAARPPWTFAQEYEGIEQWRAYLRDPWLPQARPAAPEVQRRGNEPMVVSEFGNWGLPDIGALRACYGGSEPWWFETGIEWGDGVTYPHGIEQRFRAWHLDKVFPTLADLAAASQRMQYTALKYQIEQMRRHPSIVGYVITELTDVHWEANGLLDICRNPKSYYDVIGQVNSADALIPIDWERIAFWEGERCEVRIALSHFSSHDLRNCRVEWNLDLWPKVGGAFERLTPRRADLTVAGTAVFDVPPLERGVRARLEMRLVDTAGQIVTGSHHELYLFPRIAVAADPIRVHAPALPRLAARLADMGYEPTPDPGSAEVVVVETMTDEWRAYAQHGGNVLWLAETGDSYQTHLGTWGLAQRLGRSWQGDWASSMSWLRQDRLFGGIPSGGTVDFAFADLTPDAVLVGLLPREFASRVHAGLFVGWVHHVVALVAERAVDRGRLLASTFRIRDQLVSHPVATIMMADMIEHLARGGRHR